MKQHFIKKFEAGGQLREFDFEKVFYAEGPYYHITFDNSENRKRETFRMKKDENGQYSIEAQVLPNWIHENELKFHDLIDEHENNPDNQ